MLALADACANGQIPAEIGLVLCNRSDAKGLQSAKDLGLKTALVDHTKFPDRVAFDMAVHEQLEQLSPDWVVLAGFMRILSSEFVNLWKGRILNIHPSLLPLYPGLDTHNRAIQAGDAEAGASVHIVTPELDAGPIIAQAKVTILPGDSPDSLATRVLAKEHQLYIDALNVCLKNDVTS